MRNKKYYYMEAVSLCDNEDFNVYSILRYIT